MTRTWRLNSQPLPLWVNHQDLAPRPSCAWTPAVCSPPPPCWLAAPPGVWWLRDSGAQPVSDPHPEVPGAGSGSGGLRILGITPLLWIGAVGHWEQETPDSKFLVLAS